MNGPELTLPEMAAALGLSPHTIRAQLRAGRITARRVGRDYVVTTAEVARYRAESLGRPGRPVRPAPPSA